jgi:hypothetical protein
MIIVNIPLQKLLPYADIRTWVENNRDLVSILAGPTYYVDGKAVPHHSGKSIFNGLLFADEQDAVYFKLKFGL